MASKRRIRRKQCGSKQRHRTQAEAVSHIIGLRCKGERGNMQAYRCGFCHGYHVGHSGGGRP